MDSPDFIPDDQMPVDQKSAPAPDFVSDDKFKPDESSEAPDFIPDSHMVEDKTHSTPGQQAETGFEGFARGATAGLSDALATGMRKAGSALGVSDENLHYIAPDPKDMAARQTANPVEAGASELAGNVGLMTKLPQIGSKAINGMIQMGLISAGDELSKAMLGQGDPIDAAAMHVAGSTGLGLLMGGIFGKVEQLGSKSLQALENSKLGSKLPSFLSGVGHAATFPGEEISSLGKSALTKEEIKNLDEKAFRIGQNFFNTFTGNAPKTIARIAAPSLGGYLGGVGGAAAASGIEYGVEKLAPNISKKLAPVILKIAATGGPADSIGQVMDHATKMDKGYRRITKGIEALFNAGGNKFLDYETTTQEREKLKHFIENDDFGQQIQDENMNQSESGYAAGGKVEPKIQVPNAIANIYPEQNTLITKNKGNISGYLNSVRPQKNQPRLPFDREQKDPQKERDYDKVLDLANQPLSILKHIKDGTLLPKQMTHFTNMYPELHSHLAKKMTEKIMEHQLDETKKPPRHVRQAMSLFMGTNLESSMTQPNIAAAQNVFAMQKAQKQAPKGSSTSLSKMGQNAMTDDQSREKRLNKN